MCLSCQLDLSTLAKEHTHRLELPLEESRGSVVLLVTLTASSHVCISDLSVTPLDDPQERREIIKRYVSGTLNATDRLLLMHFNELCRSSYVGFYGCSAAPVPNLELNAWIHRLIQDVHVKWWTSKSGFFPQWQSAWCSSDRPKISLFMCIYFYLCIYIYNSPYTDAIIKAQSILITNLQQ